MRRYAGVALASIAILAVAACGDDSGSSSSATTAATTAGGATTAAPATTSAASTASTAAAPTGTPLKLAMLVDQSSPNADGQKQAGDIAKAWVAYTNSNGGVAGHPVDITIKDSKADAPTSQALAQALVADKSIVAILTVDSGGEPSFGKILSDGGLPVIGGMGYYPTLWSALPNYFGITTTFPAVVDEQVVAAGAVSAKVAAVATCAEVASCAAAVPVFDNAVKALGLTNGGQIKVAANAPNYTAECLQFVNKKVDFVQISASAALGLRMYADCVEQGFNGWFGASAGTVTPNIYAAPGSEKLKLTGGLNAFPWYVDAPPVQHFRDVMAAQNVDQKTYGMPTATATWASLELFKKTMEAAKATLPASPTRTDVINAYGQVKNETLDGLLPQPMTFTANQPAPKVNCFWLYKLEGGKLSGSFTPTCDTASK